MSASNEPDQDWLRGTAPELPDEELLAALGDEFLAYVCFTDPSRIAETRRGQPLDEDRRLVLEMTLRLARQFSTWRRPNASNDEFVPPAGEEFEPLAMSFGQFFALTDEGTTVADSLRQRAGGTIRTLPDPEVDPVRHALHWVMRDLWPYSLLPRNERTRSPFPLGGVVAAGFNHPAQRALREAVQQVREPLRQLYPDVSEELADSMRVASSSGTTGSVQIALLGERLISGAMERCIGRATGGDALFDELDQQLAELRLLARGRLVEVPATVGLSGLKLASGNELATALGVVRPVTMLEAEPFPGSANPDVLLTVDFPLRYTRLKEGSAASGAPPGYWDSWREFEARVDLLRLAVLLARGPASGQILRTVSEQVHDPFFAGGLRGRLVSAPFSIPLDAADVPEIVKWAERIHRYFRPEIALAVRRTISAADGLRAPDDALVDAVIALESLFGTGESEVGFRLQTAMAFLMGTDERSRATIHREVGDLYSARSRLVHGTGMADQEELFRLRQRAVELAVACIRLLFSSHHRLIPDTGRGKRIILAAGQLGTGSAAATSSRH